MLSLECMGSRLKSPVYSRAFRTGSIDEGIFSTLAQRVSLGIINFSHACSVRIWASFIQCSEKENTFSWDHLKL